MRRSLPGMNAELASAVRRVSAHLDRLPESDRPDVAGERWANLERELDRAAGAGDREAARLAIETWETETMTVLARCVDGSKVGSSS